MPSKLYDCKTQSYFNSKDEQLKERKRRDLISQKIRYWKKTYNYDLQKEDYDEFNKHVNIIKKVHKFHDFIVNYNEKNKTISKSHLELYAKNYKEIKIGLTIKDYLKTLKKINTENNNEENEKINKDINEEKINEPINRKNEKYIIDNW